MNKTLSMFTVSKGYLRHAFQEFKTFHFTQATIDILNKTEQLNSERHYRVYYCLFKKKMIKIEIYEKCSIFSLKINKKD